MTKSAKHLEAKTSINTKLPSELEVTIMSFGYKQGQPPLANVVFDVRFLSNPYWIEELRPLTGTDLPVQQYVLNQPMAAIFLRSINDLLCNVLPRMIELGADKFVIAFGCTGGQHRSVAIAEALASSLRQTFLQCSITTMHRELGSLQRNSNRCNEGKK